MFDDENLHHDSMIFQERFDLMYHHTTSPFDDDDDRVLVVRLFNFKQQI